ncbi:testis-expressed protein 50 [Molossus nigricans]
MPVQGLPPISLLLFICLLRESACICDGTAWAKVGWEIFPEEMPYLKVKLSPSQCLPYPLDKLCCNFANKDLLQSFLYLVYILVQAIFFILVVLSTCYLWMKWKKHKRKLERHASLDTVGNEPEGRPFSDIDQLLYKLLATTSMMSAYLDQKSRRSTGRKSQPGKLKRKSRGGARRHHEPGPPPNVETTQEAC